ncbi:MAG TPA: MFS transporter, partial [Friedmanniella sp.]
MATHTTTRVADAPVSILHQPKSVWAVAFACVIAFMGIGLVDPILPAISAQLGATTAQTELLFTSYLLVTGLAMFFTSFVSSRLGAKPTLLVGLALIVLFAALAGASGSVNEVIGFRAGWGLGNALFISTALATIVGAASGGADRAIILYEAALGLGIAVGPLLGGALGSISWRGPFFGTAVLMAIGLLAIVVLLGKIPAPAVRVPLSATFRALRHPTLLTLGLTALFYNFGFFTLLAYTPLPLDLGVHELGIVFFGWGVLVAIGAIFCAPRLSARWRPVSLLSIAMALLAADLLVIALGLSSKPVMIAAIIASGVVLGTS